MTEPATSTFPTCVSVVGEAISILSVASQVFRPNRKRKNQKRSSLTLAVSGFGAASRLPKQRPAS